MQCKRAIISKNEMRTQKKKLDNKNECITESCHHEGTYPKGIKPSHDYLPKKNVNTQMKILNTKL